MDFKTMMMTYYFCIIPWLVILVLGITVLNHRLAKKTTDLTSLTYLPTGEIVKTFDIPQYIRDNPFTFDNLQKALDGFTITPKNDDLTPIMKVGVRVPYFLEKSFKETLKREEFWYGVLEAYVFAKRKHSVITITVLPTDQKTWTSEFALATDLKLSFTCVGDTIAVILQSGDSQTTYHTFEFSIG